jgi:hypothetical protein
LADTSRTVKLSAIVSIVNRAAQRRKPQRWHLPAVDPDWTPIDT